MEEFLKSEGIAKTNTIFKPGPMGPGNHKVIILLSNAPQPAIVRLSTGRKTHCSLGTLQGFAGNGTPLLAV